MKYCETRKAYIKNIDALVESIRAKGVLIKDYTRRPKVDDMTVRETAQGIIKIARRIQQIADERMNLPS
jgi:hypothetical protein